MPSSALATSPSSLELLHRAGLSPMEVIGSATSLAAKAIGMERDGWRDQSRASRRPDLHQRRPAESISALCARVSTVVLGGEIVVDQGREQATARETVTERLRRRNGRLIPGLMIRGGATVQPVPGEGGSLRGMSEGASAMSHSEPVMARYRAKTASARSGRARHVREFSPFHEPAYRIEPGEVVAGRNALRGIGQDPAVGDALPAMPRCATKSAG